MHLLNLGIQLFYRNYFSKTKILLILFITLFSCSYILSPFNFFIYFAFIPLLIFYENLTDRKEAFRIGYLVGFFINAILFFWIINYKIEGYLIFILFNSLQFGLFGYLYSHLEKFSLNIRLLIFPFLWTALEFIKEFGDLRMNWINIGYTQGNYLTLIQFADITGINGIVFWICLINVVLYKIIFHDKFKIYFVILVLLFVLPFTYGYVKLNQQKESKGIVAAYVQPNMDSYEKWNINKKGQNIKSLVEFTNGLDIDKNNLIVLPETALPFSIQTITNDTILSDIMNKLYNKTILTGVLYKSDKQKYNSAAVYRLGKFSGEIYHKKMLVPVEEKLPFSPLYEFMVSDSILSNYYRSGKEYTVFKTVQNVFSGQLNGDIWSYDHDIKKIESIDFSCVICWESSFPSFVRQFTLRGAKFLVVITNDEWFGYTSQPYQHLNTSRIRAIETGKSIIHCSNAGISSFIDFDGRFFGSSKLYEKTYSKNFIPLNTNKTFFTIFGDLIGRFSTIFIFIFFILIFYKNKFMK